MPAARDMADLVALIDGLESLLEHADLSELEVEAGGTTVVLRAPSATARASLAAHEDVLPAPADGAQGTAGHGHGGAPAATAPTVHVVTAPLTGVFYRSPSPGAQPYLREGGPVSAGQVIGLIEAMKLFNEIKSDVSGTVRRLVAGDGALVKARDVLIEVEPA